MDKEFSSFLQNNHDNLKEIIKILSKKFEYVSILATDCVGQKIVVSEKNILVQDSSWNERGFVLRVYKQGLFSEFSFDKIDSVATLCEKVINSVDVSEPLYKSIYVKINKNDLYEEEKMEKEFSRMNEYEHVSLADIISKSKKIINDSMEENEYIISATCISEYLKISKMFVSTNKDLKQVYAWATARYQCIVNRDNITRFNYGGESSVSLQEALFKLQKIIKKINNEASALLDSTNIVPGEYDCITSPEISGLIAHEAFGHGVEMDMFVKNRALGQQYIGKKVGSELVEMHEGAIPFKDVSSYFFDDEGFLGQDTVEIKDGILLTGIADAIAAGKLKIKPTGNGKRENYQHKAYTRMTNTYFAPKQANLEDMIASIKFGYLIDVESSGMEDPKNWGIQCIALLGKEIVNGKLTGKVVSPIIMTGYVPDLLNSISMVSKDFALYGNGACGKGYKEWVKTSVGGPYLKVRVKLG